MGGYAKLHNFANYARFRCRKFSECFEVGNPPCRFDRAFAATESFELETYLYDGLSRHGNYAGPTGRDSFHALAFSHGFSVGSILRLFHQGTALSQLGIDFANS